MYIIRIYIYVCIRCTQGNFQKKKKKINNNVISACKLVYSSMGSACTAGFISAAFLRNPPPEEISHILLLADRSGQQESTEDHIAANRGSQGAEVPTCTTCTPSVATFGAGLPPVSAKLIKRIQEGEFIEMGELAIDWLGLPSVEDSTETSRSKRRPVTSIVEWAQCFSNYIAVLVQAQPERVADLLGYQHLILEAHLEYEGDGWAAYDRRFRQIAATAPGGLWARRDVDLWNMVFSGCRHRPYCQYCFGSTHRSEDCSGAADTAVTPSKGRGPSLPRIQTIRICRDWNFSPLPHCSYPECKFIHTCLACSKDPFPGDKNHKLIHCPKSSYQPPEPTARPLMGLPQQ